MRRELLLAAIVLFLIGCCVGYLVHAYGSERYELHPWQVDNFPGCYVLDRHSGNLFYVVGDTSKPVEGTRSYR